MELSLLLLTCISALIGAAYIPKDIRKKPGKCPYVQDIANRKCPLPPNVQDMVAFNNFLMSIAECLFDGDCKGNDKCCFDGCKTKCTRVMKWDRDEIHAGKCPPVDTSHRRGCKYVDDSMMQNKCIRDKDCQRNEKCCFDGCRVNCVQVSKFPKMKPGQCPPKFVPEGQKCKSASTVGDALPTEVTQGVNYCRSDDDCNGTSKCCDDGCHRKCSPPMFLKESDIKTKSETRKRVDKLLDEYKTTAQRTEMTLEVQQGEILQAGETLAEMPIKSAGKEPKFKLKEERTFVMIKPDAVRRGLISEITSRFEKKGYKLVAMKLVQVRFDFIHLVLKHRLYFLPASQ